MSDPSEPNPQDNNDNNNNNNGPNRVQEFQADAFQFYFQFLKPLVLDLPTPEDKAVAAAWVQKIEADPGTEEGQNIRLDYLKLFLFVLQRGRLSGIFKKQPPAGPLPPFPQGFSMTDMGNLMIDQDDRQTAGGGDARAIPYTIEISNDLREFVAAQEVPNFGVQMYYAWSSEDPIHKWNLFDEEKFPLYVLEKIKQIKESKLEEPGVKQKSLDCQKKPCDSPLIEKFSKKKVKSPQEIEKSQGRSYHAYIGLVNRSGGGFKEACEETAKFKEFCEDLRRERALMRKRQGRYMTMGPIPPLESPGHHYGEDYYNAVRVGVSPRDCACPRPFHQPGCEYYVGGFDEYFPEPSPPPVCRRTPTPQPSPQPQPQPSPVCPAASGPPPGTPAGPSGQACPVSRSPQPCPTAEEEVVQECPRKQLRQSDIDRMTLAIPPNTELGEDDVYNHEYFENIKVGVSPRRECGCPPPFHVPGCEQYMTGFEEYFAPEDISPARKGPQGLFPPTMPFTPPKSAGRRNISLRPPEPSLVASGSLCPESSSRRSPSPAARSYNAQGYLIPPPDNFPQSPNCCSCNTTCGCSCPRCPTKTPEGAAPRPSHTPKSLNYQAVPLQNLENQLGSSPPANPATCYENMAGSNGPPYVCPPNESPPMPSNLPRQELKPKRAPATPHPRKRRAHLIEAPRTPFQRILPCTSPDSAMTGGGPFAPMLTSTPIPWVKTKTPNMPFDEHDPYDSYQDYVGGPFSPILPFTLDVWRKYVPNIRTNLPIQEVVDYIREREGPGIKLHPYNPMSAYPKPPPTPTLVCPEPPPRPPGGLPEKYFHPASDPESREPFEDALSGESMDECPRESSSCEWEELRGQCVSKQDQGQFTPFQQRLERAQGIRSTRGTRPSRLPVARPRQMLAPDPITVRRTGSGTRAQAPPKPPRRNMPRPEPPPRPEPMQRQECPRPEQMQRQECPRPEQMQRQECPRPEPMPRAEAYLRPEAPPKPPRRYPPRPESARAESPPAAMPRAGPSTECPQTPKQMRRRPRILTSTPIKSNFNYPGFEMTYEPSAIYGEEQSMFQNMSSIMEPPSWVPPPPPNLSPIRQESESPQVISDTYECSI